MPAADIVIKGAREHNLRSVDVVLPRNQLICLTGVSGSGKSSLAFDTLYAEGQRRYVESLSSFARQFLGQMPKPDVDHISGLSPSISISQKSSGNNPRSTVGTITEIYDYLRVLYARVGQGHCPQCGRPITAQTREQIIDRILALPAEDAVRRARPGDPRPEGRVPRPVRGPAASRASSGRASTATSCRSPTTLRSTARCGTTSKSSSTGSIAGPSIRSRLAEGGGHGARRGQGQSDHRGRRTSDEQASEPSRPRRRAKTTKTETRTPRLARTRQRPPSAAPAGTQPGDIVLSAHYACTHCGLSFDPPTPQLFSFNSPQGMCLECDGLGEFYSFDPELLVPDAEKSFKEGCIELIGPWKDLGRWRRHIYQGVADTMERKLELAEGTLLETPWNELDRRASQTSGSGAPATSTSRTPGGPASRRRSTAARSKASSPSCSTSIAPARARCSSGSSKST